MLGDYVRVMITGGAGFIGSHLCEEILRHGKQVVVVDDLSTGKKDNLPLGVEFIEMNITDYSKLRDAMKDIDIVFHVAAQPSTRSSIENPDLDFRSNTVGTYNVLAAARQTGVRRLVYTSSSAVYGEPKGLPILETDLPVPGTPYGASKLCGEHYCTAFASVYHLACTCLRPFNVYGPHENLETSLDEVVQYTLSIMEGRPVTIHGDGSQTRDFVYVGDVVRAHILAADNDKSIGKVFNIGTGLETSINDLVKRIEEVTDRKGTIEHKPWPEGDVRREYADISFAREIIDYAPETELVQGLQHLISGVGPCRGQIHSYGFGGSIHGN
jgi:UDP-glucose 4-epimerase